jgi:hypothetical protein
MAASSGARTTAGSARFGASSGALAEQVHEQRGVVQWSPVILIWAGRAKRSPSGRGLILMSRGSPYRRATDFTQTRAVLLLPLACGWIRTHSS